MLRYPKLRMKLITLGLHQNSHCCIESKDDFVKSVGFRILALIESLVHSYYEIFKYFYINKIKKNYWI